MYVPIFLREDLGTVVTVELDDLLGCEQRSLVLAGRRQHRCDQAARACAGDQVEVVSDPSVLTVYRLQQNQQELVLNKQRKSVQHA